ncbi:MAG: response regulator transcription factor [Alistipes sp.]|nr:response regulator transcription factor [Alistipes sp.]
MGSKQILIVEDEVALGRILSDTLRGAGYDVVLESDGATGLATFRRLRPDMVIADIMLPKMDGLTMVERMRRMDANVEVLFLSARSGAEDVVEGFRRGGNDYLRKPFSLDELLARVAALMSRHPSTPKARDSLHTIGHYHHDSHRWTLTINGTTRRLTARESAILERLATHVGAVVDTRELLLDIWGDDNYYNLRSLNVFISRLRGYLSQDRRITIQSVRGSGYRLMVARDDAEE